MTDTVGPSSSPARHITTPASAEVNCPRENSRPWSIESQPLKIQVSTKTVAIKTDDVMQRVPATIRRRDAAALES